MAMSLRDLGNEQFKLGNFIEAEQLYSQAVQHTYRDSKAFANRALTRLKLSDWHGAETDARTAIDIYGAKDRSAPAMKAYYYLAQALLELRHTEEALSIAKRSYAICLETNDSSSEVLSQFVLRVKQGQWRNRERTRLRDLNETLGFLEDLLDQRIEKDLEDIEFRFARQELGMAGREEERTSLGKEAEERRKLLREVFANPQRPETTERIVPDYMIDNITFEVMHDPVITPSGASYERVGLLKHLKVSGVDPLTRQPLTEKQLIPNVALRNACSEFLERNGWAVDY